MKNSYYNIEKRREKIISVLTVENLKSVDDLAKLLDVSVPTIRRDLTILEQMGLIKRTHGGAIINQITELNPSTRLIRIQDALGKVACSFIKDGETIFLNTSQTALHCLSWIGDKRVNVITNNVRAAGVELNPNTTIILTGGEIRFPKEALVNGFAIDTISKVNANIAILGCTGISIEGGVTTEMLQEAKINSLMVSRSTRLRIIVADHRKINRTSNFLTSKLSNIDYLITDIYANPDEVQKLENTGIRVILVDPDTVLK